MNINEDEIKNNYKIVHKYYKLKKSNINNKYSFINDNKGILITPKAGFVIKIKTGKHKTFINVVTSKAIR